MSGPFLSLIATGIPDHTGHEDREAFIGKNKPPGDV